MSPEFWDKTKLMFINGTADVKRSFNKGGVTVDHANENINLASPFSAKGCINVDQGHCPCVDVKHAALKQKARQRI